MAVTRSSPTNELRRPTQKRKRNQTFGSGLFDFGSRQLPTSGGIFPGLRVGAGLNFGRPPAGGGRTFGGDFTSGLVGESAGQRFQGLPNLLGRAIGGISDLATTGAATLGDIGLGASLLPGFLGTGEIRPESGFQRSLFNRPRGDTRTEAPLEAPAEVPAEVPGAVQPAATQDLLGGVAGAGIAGGVAGAGFAGGAVGPGGGGASVTQIMDAFAGIRGEVPTDEDITTMLGRQLTSEELIDIQLNRERINNELFGDPRGLRSPFFGRKLFDAPRQAREEFTRTDQLAAALEQARRGDLSPQEIETVENERRQEMANIINRRFDRGRLAEEEFNRIKRQGVSKIGADLAGGAANFSTTQVASITREIDAGRDRIAELEDQRQEALAVNDIDAVQRIEDRQESLFDRGQARAELLLDAAQETRAQREFGDEFGFLVRELDVDERESIARIANMTRDDSRDIVDLIFETFGAAGFAGLNQKELQALEAKAELPAGTLLRNLQTLEEQDAAAEKRTPLKFISGTKQQRAGVFDPDTGSFTPIGQAMRAAVGKAGLSEGDFFNLEDAFWAAEDKPFFVSKLSKDFRDVLLSDPSKTAAMHLTIAPKEQEALALYSRAKFDLADDESFTREQAFEFFNNFGLDPDQDENENIKRAIDADFGGGISRTLRGILAKVGINI